LPLRRRGLWWTVVPLLLLFSLAIWLYTRRSAPSVPAARKIVAVLPFSNEGAGPDFNYLRYAIANDLVTDLTSTRSLTVRPFASTSKYGSQPADPEAVGKELHVTDVVAGGFLLDKQNLRVNLELVDVAGNQVLWREEVTVSPQELVTLHDKLALRAVKGLLPAMNIANASAADMPAPKNEQALDLFLHSITVPLDPEPNQTAIKMLESSVSLDKDYAPAWGELGWRYYIDYHYGNGGEAAVAKALQSYQRQAELDPNVPSVSTTIRVEQGDLNGAYDQAAEFLRRRPDVSIAHYSMSYVLRYAGLLDEASKECDKALAIDPGFNVFRSCATPFILSGDYAHAQKFIRLDENSGVAATSRTFIALRTGNTAAVLAESSAMSKTGLHYGDLARSCLKPRRKSRLIPGCRWMLKKCTAVPRSSASVDSATPRSANSAKQSLGIIAPIRRWTRIHFLSHFATALNSRSHGKLASSARKGFSHTENRWAPHQRGSSRNETN
jgi:TolB-like protein